MARLTLANGRTLDTDTGQMTGGNRSDDPYGIDAPDAPSTGGGSSGGGSTGGGSGGNDPAAFAPTGFNLPVNVYDQITQLAHQYGVPAGYLAGAIYYSRTGGFGTGRNEVSTAEIEKMAAALQGQAGTGSWAGALDKVVGAGRGALVEQLAPKGVLDPRAVTSPGGPATGTGGPTAAQKQLSAPVTADDIASLYQTYLGRAPEDQGAIDGRLGRTYGEVLAEISGGKEAAQYRLQGDKINAIRSNWANSMWQSLFGRPPTNTEIMQIITNGWNQQQTEAYLSNQPYGTTGKTVGQVANLRDAIGKAFAKLGLPAPTDAQVNFALVNNMPITNVDAYAAQTAKQTWGTNPTAYTDYRTKIAEAYSQFGAVMNPNDVPPEILAAAVAGKWSADQITRSVGSQQAPGAPQGTTLDRYKATQDVAKQVWGTYFPGTPIPQAYQDQFLAMTPDQITAFIGNLPSPDAAQAGAVVPAKAYQDAKTIAQGALNQWGAVGRVPSAAELAHFAAAGMDSEAIAKFYQNDPDVVRANPGAPYGLTRSDYRQDRSAIEKSYAQDFQKPADLEHTTAKQNDTAPGGDAAEPDWLSAIFKNKINPQQANAMFADTFKRLGRAPTTDEVGQYQSRHTSTFSATGPAAGGPTSPSLAGPQTGRR